MFRIEFLLKRLFLMTGGSGHFEILASKAYACVPGVKRQELDATSAKFSQAE